MSRISQMAKGFVFRTSLPSQTVVQVEIVGSRDDFARIRCIVRRGTSKRRVGRSESRNLRMTG